MLETKIIGGTLKTFVLCLVVLFVSSSIYSQEAAVQDSSNIFKITLNDDTEFICRIVSDLESKLVIKTLGGSEFTVEKSMIAEKEVIETILRDSDLLRKDPNGTRLFFAPTGRTLKAGQGYISDFELLLPFLGVGITDYLTFSGGVSLVPGAEEQLLYFAPKVSIHQDGNSGISVGTLFMHIEENTLGIAYGVSTFGEDNVSATMGIGYGFANGKLAKSPTIVLGGEAQLSNSIKLITENWIIPNLDGGIVSFGIRFFGDHLAADFALMTSTKASGSFPFVPWLGFCYNF